jgi:hypothetical protein
MGEATAARRPRFENLSELRGHVRRLVDADRAGRLRMHGNWTLGQALGHLAAWINYAYEGYPFKTPAIIRMLLRLRLNRMLRDGMPTGVRIPGAAAGTYGTDVLPTDEGAARYLAALDRLEREPAKFHSPGFGVLTEPQRILLNLRHAECHLGNFEVIED